jgi:hypothetical protein
MPGFNHYAKLTRLLAAEPEGWYIMLIDQPTTATNFRGEKVRFDHYYRLYHADGTQIKYGKFQQISRLAQALSIDVDELPIVT